MADRLTTVEVPPRTDLRHRGAGPKGTDRPGRGSPAHTARTSRRRAAQVSPPLTAPAYALTLPLRTSFVYTLDTATLDVIGASGTWDTSNHWRLALTARDDAGIVSTLATTTYASAGAGRVELTPPAPVTLDADATPRLGVSVSKVGTPPPLVGLAGTASLAGTLKPTTYAYDANGNTVGIAGPGGVTTLTWDAENRLTSVASPDGTEAYTYDSTTSVPGKVTGLRRSKTTSAGTTHFVWDQQNLLAELDGALARVSQYTDFPGRWGGLSAARAGGASQYFGFDLSANTRAVFDTLGAVDQTALYSAFGPMLAGNLAGPYGFGAQVGYYTVLLSILARARELDPRTGRWMGRDPLGRFNATGVFGYVSACPITRVDSSGLDDILFPDWDTAIGAWTTELGGGLSVLQDIYEWTDDAYAEVSRSGSLARQGASLAGGVADAQGALAAVVALGYVVGAVGLAVQANSVLEAMERSTRCNRQCCSDWQCDGPWQLGLVALVLGAAAFLFTFPWSIGVGLAGAVAGTWSSALASSSEDCYLPG